MKNLLLFLSILLYASTSAQDWVEEMHDPKSNFYDVQNSFNTYHQGKAYEKGKGYKQFKRWEWYWEPRVYPSGNRPNEREMDRVYKDIASKADESSAKSSANWTSLGPTDWQASGSVTPGIGRVNVTAVDPTDPNVIYIGAASGGVWKSVDGGGSWVPLFDDMPTLAVSGIAIDPSNSDIIYVATGDGDLGDAYSVGVVKSNDGGVSWSNAGLLQHRAKRARSYKLLMHPTDPATLLCATSYGLWKTTDAATSWTLVQEGPISDVEYKPGDPSVVYACSLMEFFRSVNDGDTFSQVSMGLPLASDVIGFDIAVSPDAPGMVYAICGDRFTSGFNGLYRSTDSGSSFSLRSSTPNIFGYSDDGSDFGGQAWYDMGLAVDPNDAEVVYAAGIFIWKSTDGGSSWNVNAYWTVLPLPYEYVHADVHFLDFQGNVLYAGSDGGVFRTDNGGLDWTDISAGLSVTQVYRLGGSEIKPSLILAGCQDNGTILHDGIWKTIMGADGTEAAVDPIDTLVCYASIQLGKIFRSDNGGQNFMQISTSAMGSGDWVTPYLIDPSDHNRLYAGYQELWRSDDRGDSWSMITNFGSGWRNRVLAVAPSDPDFIYFGNNEWVKHTSDGGNTWSTIDTDLPDLYPTSICVHPQDPATVYLTYSGYCEGQKVYVSNDAGLSWTNISGNLANLPVNSIVFEEGSQGGLYVGTDLGVYYTDSTLSAWQPFNTGLPNILVNELEINYATSKIRAATYGRGLWESDLFTASTLPPVAGLAFTETGSCAGDSVHFTDQSLYASPIWDWQFPGGTPASSTDRSPSVVYPISGSYQVSLSMENANGVDTFTTNVLYEVELEEMELSMVFDQYSDEISWNVLDLNGAEVASGGGYGCYQQNDTLDLQFCIPVGCYTFYIYDAFGDGLCCSVFTGDGSFELSSVQQGVIGSGGEFTLVDSVAFCTISTSIEARTAPRLNVFPNPSSGTVRVTIPESGTGKLLVLDAAGRLLREVYTDTQETSLDLSSYPAGSYVLEWIGPGSKYSSILLLTK